MTTPLDTLIRALSRLPGLGRRSVERAALTGETALSQKVKCVKTRALALLSIVLLAASCSTTTPNPLCPRQCQVNATSVLPLVPQKNKKPEVGLVLVNAVVNGRQGLFFVDTGFWTTCLDSHFVETCGWETRVSSNSVIHAATGDIRNPKCTWVSTLALGDAKFHGFVTLLVDLQPVSSVLGNTIDGVIGMNILSNMVCQIDKKGGRLSLSLDPPKHIEDSVPIKLGNNGSVYMDALVNGEKVHMFVDTGSNVSSLNFTDWSRVATTSGIAATKALGNTTDAKGTLTNRNVRELFCDCKVGDVTCLHFPVEEDEGDSKLGMDFFQHGIVTFDFKAEKAYFENWETNQAPAAIQATNVSLTAAGPSSTTQTTQLTPRSGQ